MEARDISHIMYELIRVKQDRISMEYEDYGSRLLQQGLVLSGKYRALKVELHKQKEDYKRLHAKVSKLAKSSFTKPEKDENKHANTIDLHSPACSSIKRSRDDNNNQPIPSIMETTSCIKFASPIETAERNVKARTVSTPPQPQNNNEETMLTPSHYDHEQLNFGEKHDQPNAMMTDHAPSSWITTTPETTIPVRPRTPPTLLSEPTSTNNPPTPSSPIVDTKSTFPRSFTTSTLLTQTKVLLSKSKRSVTEHALRPPKSLDPTSDTDSKKHFPARSISSPENAQGKGKENMVPGKISFEKVTHRSVDRASSPQIIIIDDDDDDDDLDPKEAVEKVQKSEAEEEEEEESLAKVSPLITSDKKRKEIGRKSISDAPSNLLPVYPTTATSSSNIVPSITVTEELIRKQLTKNHRISRSKSYHVPNTTTTTTTASSTATTTLHDLRDARRATLFSSSSSSSSSSSGATNSNTTNTDTITNTNTAAPTTTTTGGKKLAHRSVSLFQPTTYPPLPGLKCVEVVRKKEDRAALPGHTCEECDKFYNAMIQQGIIQPGEKKEFLKECSRHKAKWTPPSTPDGFWDISLRTPDDWR